MLHESGILDVPSRINRDEDECLARSVSVVPSLSRKGMAGSIAGLIHPRASSAAGVDETLVHSRNFAYSCRYHRHREGTFGMEFFKTDEGKLHIIRVCRESSSWSCCWAVVPLGALRGDEDFRAL